jgi:hypothetical protein
VTHGRHKRFTFAVQNVYHIKSLNELQFMPLTAGTLQNRKCTFVNVIERFAVYNTVSITGLFNHTPWSFRLDEHPKVTI